MARKAQGVSQDVNAMMDKLGGHDTIVLTDENGVEYRGRYTRRLVKSMEAKGVTAEAAAAKLDGGTLTGIEEFLEEFVFPAFRAEQPALDFETFLDVWTSQPDKQELLEAFMLLFSAPSMALVANPTETRAKFRLA